MAVPTVVLADVLVGVLAGVLAVVPYVAPRAALKVVRTVAMNVGLEVGGRVLPYAVPKAVAWAQRQAPVQGALQSFLSGVVGCAPREKSQKVPWWVAPEAPWGPHTTYSLADSGIVRVGRMGLCPGTSRNALMGSSSLQASSRREVVV